MQENHKATIGISPMPEILNPQCSCTKCDSVTCFSQRRKDLPCACENCTNNCMINNSSLNISDSKTSSLYFKELEREQGIENITKELIKKEILYDFDKNNKAKTINKEESKLIYKTVDSIENILLQDGTDRLNRLHDLVKSSRKEASPSRVKLSAQVMDVSFDDFQKSLSKPNFSSNIANLSPYDIFNKIKEAYKACSCKVCECIVGKSYQSETCKCKPCECSDCVSISRRVRSFTNGEPVPKHDEGCPCIRCDRGSCKGIAKDMKKNIKRVKTSEAKCCDCIGVLKYDYLNDIDDLTQSCNCEPCRCIECTLKSIRKQRLVVAPVGEDYQQRNECQCSPCECFSCGHYGLSSNVHHEMSTSVNRHPQCHCETCINEACIPDGNQSCRCERQSKVMSKPFQQDSHDYDIRRLNVTYEDLLRRRYNHDTIAMYAAVPDPCVRRKENKKQCDCGPCECIKCNYKAINIEQARACEQFQPIQNYRLRNESKDCECSPCECQICTKQNSNLANFENLTDCSNRDILTNSSIEVESRVSKKPKSKFLTGNCECHPCECVECEKLMTTCVGDICQCSNCKCENCIKETYSNEVIYPVKKGERMTPSLYKNKIKDAFIESCFSNLEANEEILKQRVGFRQSLKKPSAFNPVQKNKIRDDYINHVSHQKCFQENYSNQQAFPRQSIAETVNRSQSSKYANRKKLRSERNEPILEATLSVDSSMSYKESGSITPTRCKVNWESSCNSSGYDYPSYLIHFPETTVETCLNDVMQFDTGNSLTSNNSVGKEHYTDFNMNIQKRSKYQHTRKFISEEKPTKSLDDKRLRKENLFCKKSFHLEDNPYRLQNIEVQHIKYEHSVNHDSFPKIHENISLAASNKSNTKNVKPDDDFKRALNTLQEARAFSQHLVSLLEQYEKANREFESVSEKLKKPNDSLLFKITNTASTADFNNLFERDVPTKDQNPKKSSGSSTEELVDINKNTNKINDFPHSHAVYYNLEIENESKENIQTTNVICDDNNEGRDESGDDLININNELLKTIFEEKESTSIGHKYDKKRVVKRLHKRYSKMYRRPTSFKRLKRFTYTSSDAIENDTEEKINPIQGNNTEIKEKPYRTLNETDVAEDTTGDYESESKSSYDEEVVNNVIQIKKSTAELEVSLPEKDSKEDHTLQKNFVIIKQPVIEHSRLIFDIKNDGSSILKNNNFNKDSNMNNPRIPLVPSLERSEKAATKNKSRLQPNENAMYLYENKALMKLHAEVKKLLDLPNLRSLRRTSVGEQKGQQVLSPKKLSKSSFSQTSPGLSVRHSKEGTSMTASSSKNICEALKVNFLNVRRVSDHTALVKWNTPRALNNVRGYELLVDGRAVKKILNPSRCMAVVTCLPHSEKVILTVRTVVSPPCSDRCPAATVIYQPKAK